MNTQATVNQLLDTMHGATSAQINTTTINPVAKVSGKYGAPMGRGSYGKPYHENKDVVVRKMPLDSGGYDKGGAYWGHGEPMYYATDGVQYVAYTRAKSRAEAISLLGLTKQQVKRA